MNQASLPVAIIGAGPVGLAAAAYLLARGETPLVLEAGPAAGHAIRQWHHVRMFTPWRFCVDRAAAALLATRGWSPPPAEDLPTGGELVARYLEPLAAALAPYLHVNARVIAVSRQNTDKLRTAGRERLPFVLRIAAPDGTTRRVMARAVIDASGTWFTPNPAGADGLPALGERQAAERIASGIPDVLGADREIYRGRKTAVVGSGHSALNALIELAALREEAPGTRLHWLIRKDRIETAFGGEAADALPARGALGIAARALVEAGAVEVLAPFRIEAIGRGAGGALRIEGDHAGAPAQLAADRMIVATGFRPDFTMLREVRLALDPWLECAGSIGPLIDPNLHSCGTVRPHGAAALAHPEADFFIAGMKSYGRAPTFLLATGYEQVRSIAAHLVGDEEAAARVELELPETGVCTARPAPRIAVPSAKSCCGAAKPEPAIAAARADCCG
ncbi:MAG TPA: FAD-dependent oxidoreductase [Stellaceae bacterium]|nr:FAD-dependent oxidoreductase [Stellaceae bacterium]